MWRDTRGRRIHALFQTLQELKRPWIPNERARWYVRVHGTGELSGPLEDVEIAYHLYTGTFGRREVVISAADDERRYVVGEHTFLSSWIGARGKERTLLNNLQRSVEVLKELRRSAEEELLRHRRDLTEEEREAFLVLGLSPGTLPEELRRHHRLLALANHPDRGGSLQRMKEINWAYTVALQASGASARGLPPS